MAYVIIQEDMIRLYSIPCYVKILAIELKLAIECFLQYEHLIDTYMTPDLCTRNKALSRH